MTQMSSHSSSPLEPEDAKVALRAALRKVRLQRSERRIAEHADALRDQVLAIPTVGGASCVSVYASRPHEPGTGPLIQALHEHGVKVMIPLLGDGLQRGWAWYRGAEDLIERAPGRPPEPSGDFLPFETISQADVVVVPALAIDSAGRRLGQGGGWYDRALPLAAEGVPFIALVYDNEVFDAEQSPVPTEAHDIGVHAVVTPSKVMHLPA
ncbi:5-formyltetrahydrofolate cyclo-ligase [Demequina capsici]|uniref:5-formyltetrahydrofolate cyclo-ligase n=1 Tax=Demequina capsici TaxID=3075620 RepID=A0AA96JA19_9MICO|nr:MULTISPECIES: 5-formyltetrahydrofolate cyclo-ligase [unclassified Demequina]WNM25005.1 5-formyltetrahydrofolate cyclo-ligase [Demequina sp. OYTSA14]WNM27912.1 5-formyltetrahydrofolate cyclo-ligase [Demequina sp. PMTSA13]